ncbi:uncharacterized protein LOC129600723 [Paramacrobiotus metropolitanus]|uniref:uncharacterized protein LOC129600723 n=1 Tax=Paramacrobiotus metropolitanus TaxID=2943436 RepID=UPI0024465635|nr:uncharacterized protein LOC129600723 [Paramacrobiotus metropolitanus]
MTKTLAVLCDLAWLQLSVFSVSWGCLPPPLAIPWPLPATGGPPTTNLEDLITDALRTRQDERITLPLAPNAGILEGLLSRPRLGEDATFSCEAPPGGDWRSLTWLHRGRTVFEAGHAQPEDPAQRYNVTQMSDRRLQLVVLNVTAYSGGPILCVDATPTAQLHRPTARSTPLHAPPADHARQRSLRAAARGRGARDPRGRQRNHPLPRPLAAPGGRSAQSGQPRFLALQGPYQQPAHGAAVRCAASFPDAPNLLLRSQPQTHRLQQSSRTLSGLYTAFGKLPPGRQRRRAVLLPAPRRGSRVGSRRPPASLFLPNS